MGSVPSKWEPVQLLQLWIPLPPPVEVRREERRQKPLRVVLWWCARFRGFGGIVLGRGLPFHAQKGLQGLDVLSCS